MTTQNSEFLPESAGWQQEVEKMSSTAKNSTKSGGKKNASPVMRVSPEFNSLCQAQFEVLSCILGASKCVLYFRREDAKTGQLDFVPAAVYPEKQRVWVVGEGPAGLPASGPIELPGFFSANSMFPEYPFIKRQSSGIATISLADGGISLPLEYGSVVLGTIAVWRENQKEWQDTELKQLEAIARSLAVAVILDQKHQWQANKLDRYRQVFEVEDGRKRAKKEDARRSMMSSMVILDDDELDELVGGPTAAERMQIESLDRSLDNAMEEMRKGKKESGESKSKSKSTSTKLCILEEVLAPIMSASQASRHAVKPKEVKMSQAIAEFEDIKFTCEFGDELPRVRINQRALQASKKRGRQRRLKECELCHGLQEAVSNILDNALKYVLLKEFKRRKKPFVSLSVQKDDSGQKNESFLQIIIEDNGNGVQPHELLRICEEGYRGKDVDNIPGTGLGLHIAKDLISQMNGKMSIENIEQGSLLPSVFVCLYHHPADKWFRRRTASENLPADRDKENSQKAQTSK
ncbi:hypothetical protein GUITHDRAFT_119976 [Guillardia theta CCMP2712]|uniref:Histidine kinase domain-containing protein n=1 Tax=Guillardia theta (strain CCMP2712) TaxID=905079 RepID=L1IDB9_GUITC|nr:hypothetical protein GUITHDRAFT_119976 [Guillardia theta CCMP2712]EKX33805.1 hypothetical protein GUITHDRAFT_119976 [Guillardia theta CCMP2712]|eukprot:XP_005820785.1 hypothetical protein GUITHDRAFT_119976 [Guillardia theta CCMP2712]